MYIESRYTFALTNVECGMDRLTVNFECVRASEYIAICVGTIDIRIDGERVNHSANFSSHKLHALPKQGFFFVNLIAFYWKIFGE